MVAVAAAAVAARWLAFNVVRVVVVVAEGLHLRFHYRSRTVITSA